MAISTVQFRSRFSSHDNFVKTKDVLARLKVVFGIQCLYSITYTPNANMADHSDGPGLVAWKRGQSVCQSRLFPNVLIIANGCMCSD